MRSMKSAKSATSLAVKSARRFCQISRLRAFSSACRATPFLVSDTTTARALDGSSRRVASPSRTRGSIDLVAVDASIRRAVASSPIRHPSRSAITSRVSACPIASAGRPVPKSRVRIAVADEPRRSSRRAPNIRSMSESRVSDCLPIVICSIQRISCGLQAIMRDRRHDAAVNRLEKRTDSYASSLNSATGPRSNPPPERTTPPSRASWGCAPNRWSS